MSRLVDSTKSRYRPSRANPILYRFVANQPGHPINLSPSIKTAWRPFFSNLNPAFWTIDRAIADCVAFAERERDGPGAFCGVLMPQGLCEQLPFCTFNNRLRGADGDKAGPAPWTPFGDYTLFSDAGVAINSGTGLVEEFVGGVADALRSRGLPFPRWWHLDYEESTFSSGGWGAAVLAGLSRGFYTPSLADARAATEDIDGRGNTMRDIEAARVDEGYTFTDTGSGDIVFGVNERFNFEFILSWPARSWALERAIYRVIRRHFPGTRVANYDDFNASDRAVLNPWSARTATGQPWRWTYGDAHALVQYPPLLAPPSIQLPGESHVEFYARTCRMRYAAIRAGSQPDLPLFPWVLEPGIELQGLTPTAQVFAQILNDAWDAGAFEYFGWSNDLADPHADAVLEGWNLHRAYVAAHL